MTDKQQLNAALIAALADAGFADRYYGQYAATRDRGPLPGYTSDDIMAALSGTGLDFAYEPREKIYVYREQHPRGVVGLNVAVPNSTVELILVLQADGQQIGGPFPRLARQAARLKDPDFTPEPASPKLPFGTLDELADTLRFGVQLFGDVRRAIAAAGLVG
jgi:hypothetical protein